jgi:hypothetical protein
MNESLVGNVQFREVAHTHFIVYHLSTTLLVEHHCPCLAGIFCWGVKNDPLVETSLPMLEQWSQQAQAGARQEPPVIKQTTMVQSKEVNLS